MRVSSPLTSQKRISMEKTPVASFVVADSSKEKDSIEQIVKLLYSKGNKNEGAPKVSSLEILRQENIIRNEKKLEKAEVEMRQKLPISDPYDVMVLAMKARNYSLLRYLFLEREEKLNIVIVKGRFRSDIGFDLFNYIKNNLDHELLDIIVEVGGYTSNELTFFLVNSWANLVGARRLIEILLDDINVEDLPPLADALTKSIGIDRGANFDVFLSRGVAPDERTILSVIRHGELSYYDMIKDQIPKGTIGNQLRTASSFGHTEMLEFMLDFYQMESIYSKDQIDYILSEALKEACYALHADSVRLLTERGAVTTTSEILIKVVKKANRRTHSDDACLKTYSEFIANDIGYYDETEEQCLTIIDILLRSGADPHEKWNDTTAIETSTNDIILNHLICYRGRLTKRA